MRVKSVTGALNQVCFLKETRVLMKNVLKEKGIVINNMEQFDEFLLTVGNHYTRYALEEFKREDWK